MKKFNCLNVSSKFAICGLPIRVDTYKTCSFNCAYCFSNNRKIMEFDKNIHVANLKQLSKKLDTVYNKNKINDESYLDCLLRDNITWHCGGMSDPFQPIENKLHITSDMLKITNKYDISILFSTKTDDVYDWDNLNPEIHSFQLSITNLNNRTDLEPNVANISNRLAFYDELKARGFRVGIRIQPFIPNVSDSCIVDLFKDADYFSIEGLKIVPQNREHKEYLLDTLNLDKDMFTQMGLLNLKPNIRLELYKDVIGKLNKYNIPYSIADNDLHYMTSSKCCCGENLINKSTDYNNTAMFFNNDDYTLDDVKQKIGNHSNCKCNHLFTSNRQEGCVTVLDFFNKRFDRKSSPFSKQYMYYENNKKQYTLGEFK